MIYLRRMKLRLKDYKYKQRRIIKIHMNFEMKCPKYKLDVWGLCHYKINCNNEDCKGNCAIGMDEELMKEN